MMPTIRPRVFLLLDLGVVLAIGLADLLAPSGAGIALLATIPVTLSSLAARPRDVWLTAGVACAALLSSSAVDASAPPFSPGWALNCTLIVVALAASALVALLLQHRRLEVVRARDAALTASELNLLMRSLLAHDLRAPLTVSDQALEYVEDALAEGREIDRELLADVRARLRRSLRAIDIVLDVARAEPAEGSVPYVPSSTSSVRDELEAEIASFTHEAAVRGKEIVAVLDPLDSKRLPVDGAVLRQAVAILLDNAIRYAVPGVVRVTAEVAGSGLTVRVEDAGPGLSATVAPHAANGAGLGLTLCRSLVTRSGGRLTVERDGPDGSSFVLHLPFHDTSLAEPAVLPPHATLSPNFRYTTG